MPDAIEPRSFLVVGVDHVPGGLLAVGMFEHHVLDLRILDPAFARLHVHRAEFPAFDRISYALLEPALLFLVADREPVLYKIDAGANEHFLKLRTGTQEFLVLVVAAISHHVLDAGAVVPAAVEENDFAFCRQLGDVALEIPLAALALCRSAKRHNAADARVQTFGDALDHAALAGSVASLENDDNLQTV